MNSNDSDKQKKSSPFSDTQTVDQKVLVPRHKKSSLDKHQQAQHTAEQNRQADRSDKVGN